VGDRILFHLLNYHGSHRYEVPIELTQDGIAQAVGTEQSYISRSIKKLVSNGYVQSSTGRAKQGKKKQRYYLLTYQGKKQANELKKEISNLTITLKRADGKSEMMPLKNIMSFLEKNEICSGISELNICRIISKDATLDIDQLKEIKKLQYIDFSADAPIVVHFFGRKREKATLEKWMEDKEGQNVIFLHGIAGIGKTTLAAKLIEKYRGSKHLFWHNFQDIDTLRGMLFRFSDFLLKLGYNRLDMYLRTHQKLESFEISEIFGESFGEIDALLIFDDFHKSNDDIRDFFDYILRQIVSSSKTKMLILSREIESFYHTRDVAKKIVMEMELKGLDFENSKKLLKEKGVDKRRFKEIFELTGGNPLILESKVYLERYTPEELFSKFDENEKKILEIISVYRLPVPEECLVENYDINIEKLCYLLQKSIVKRDAHNRYFVHDYLKQIFYNGVSPYLRRKYHSNAALWYRNREKPIELIEAIYHHQEAGEYEKASQFAMNKSQFIIDEGYSIELLTVLERFNKKEVVTQIWANILILMGRACNICGQWKKALQYYTQSSEIASSIDNKKLEVMAIYESGHILEEQNRFEDAMVYFKKGLHISKKIGYPPGIGECYRGIGRVHWRKEERQKAIANYIKCLDTSGKSGNLKLMASTYIDLGNVYDERYETEKAIESYYKSLDILKKVKDTYETARAYLNLAITCEHIEEFDKAIKYNSKQLILARNFQDMKLLGYGYAEIGYCHARMDEYAEARKYAKNAEEIALILQNDNIMNIINRTYGLIRKHEGRFDEAIGHFKKSLEYLKKLKASYQLPDTHFEMGLLYKELGDTDNAKKHLEKALKIYTDLGLEKSDLVKESLIMIGTAPTK
jgi:tetratricopeptide (TPR) repeat protein/DNA-binding MarR family transcriptional regulator